MSSDPAYSIGGGFREQTFSFDNEVNIYITRSMWRGVVQLPFGR